jgi:tetratricopeptide (TPR) repeat protein
MRGRCAVALLALALSIAAADDERAIALASFAAHDDAHAVAQLSALVAKSPADAPLLGALGRTELRLGRNEDAVTHLRAAVASAPNDVFWKLRLGDALGARINDVGMFGKLSLAREIHGLLDDAVKLDPKSIPAHEGLLIFYLAAPGIAGGSRDEARRQAELVRALNPGRGFACDAALLVDEKKSDAAIAAYQRAIEANPADADARFDLGLYFQQLQRYDEAVDQWEAQLRHDPKQPRALYQIGKTAVLAKRRLERGAAALQAYPQAYLLAGPEEDTDPRPAAAHWRLGNLYELQNKRDDARAEYQAALALQPDFKEARASLDQLK